MTTPIPVKFSTNAPAVAKEVDQLAASVKREAAAEASRQGAARATLRTEQDAIKSARSLRKEVDELSKARNKVYSSAAATRGGRSNFGSAEVLERAAGGGRGSPSIFRALSGMGGGAGAIGNLAGKMGISPELGAAGAAALTLKAAFSVLQDISEKNAATITAEVEGRQALIHAQEAAKQALQGRGLSYAQAHGDSILKERGLLGDNSLSNQMATHGVQSPSEVAAILAQLKPGQRGVASAMMEDFAKTGLGSSTSFAKFLSENSGSLMSQQNSVGMISRFTADSGDDLSREQVAQILANSGSGAGGSVLGIRGIQGAIDARDLSNIGGGVGAARSELATASDGGLSKTVLEQWKTQREQLDVLWKVYDSMSGFEKFMDTFSTDSKWKNVNRAELRAEAGAGM